MSSVEDGPEVEPPPIVPGPAHDLSTDELIAAVVRDLTAQRGDDEPPLDHLVALHERPTRLAYERAAGLTRSDDEALQVVGLRILRELGPAPRPVSGRRTFRPEAVREIEAVLGAATSPEVIHWAISALEYHQAQQSLDLVVGYRGHPDHGVRFAVAAALPSLVDPSAVSNEVVEAFEDLMVDPDADVRYYAAVGAIEELELRHRLSRETLAAAVEDSDEQVARFVRDAMRG